MLPYKFQGHWSIGSGEGFYHIWAWRSYWSCNPDHLNNFSFLMALEAIYEFLVAISPVVSEKSFEIVDGRRMTDDGACLNYRLLGAFGSGELKSQTPVEGIFLSNG